MRNIPILGFAAYSGTGKTTLIERLVRLLKSRGLRVAVIKHDGHSFEIDKEGKDSWRFTQAGADISIITSADKTAVVERRPLSFDEAAAFVHDVDIILVEGYKLGDFAQVGICRKAAGKGFTSPPETFAAIVTDTDVRAEGVPCFGLDDVEALADFIIRNKETFIRPVRPT